jgi:hypothetical protein
MPDIRRPSPVFFVVAFLLAAPAIGRADLLYPDPAGDNVGIHDISSISAIVTGSDLVFQVTFNNMITDPSLGGNMQDLFGFIDIDADRNAGTGASSADLLGARNVDANPGLGVEFYLDLNSVVGHAGSVDVIDTSTFLSNGTAPITYAASAITVRVPLSLLPGSNGLVNYGVIAIDNSPAVSDIAVNGDIPATSFLPTAAVPEPGSMLLFGAGLVTAACWRAFRRTWSLPPGPYGA